MLKNAMTLAVVIFLFGCTYEPKIVDAYDHRTTAEESVVVVRVETDVARTIKERELYFSIVVLECQDKSKRFPMEPYIHGHLATEFNYSISDNYVDIYGSIPTQILRQYRTPCVFLEGGGYLGGKIESRAAPLDER